MTSEQKQAIDVLRRQNLGYRKIAARLGLSENTVKSHMRRNNIRHGNLEKSGDTSDFFCPQCYKDMSEHKGRSDRRFCSTACRLAWWAANSNQLNRRAWYSCTCDACGKEFKSYGNQKRKYCGRDCYIRSRFYNGENRRCNAADVNFSQKSEKSLNNSCYKEGAVYDAQAV